jgi:hypothetical protein
MWRYATFNLPILIAAVLALLLCGCSRNVAETNNLKESASEVLDSGDGAASSAKTGVLGPPGQAKGARRGNVAAAKTGQTTYRASDFNCESMAPQRKAQCQRYGEGDESAAPLDKNSASLVALLILFRGHPGDRIWPNNRE